MKKFFLISFILILALGSKMIFHKPGNTHLLERKSLLRVQKHHKKTVKESKQYNITTKPGTVKPIENMLRHTDHVCSADFVMPLGDSCNYNSENLNMTTTAEPANSPIRHLTLDLKQSSPTPLAFNDQWVKMNTIKGLQNAASRDGKMDYVLKMSKKMHLPPSLAVVPIVESNYKIKMISSKGAAGAWQLMPETARDYGIKLKERFKLAESTKAALHLLKDLHDKFHNWELAFAAYNAGGTRVEHAMKKNPEALSIEELDLPRETKEYVYRIRKINALIMEFAHLETNISKMIRDYDY